MAATLENGESFSESTQEVQFTHSSETVTRQQSERVYSTLPAYFTKEFKCRYPTVDPNVVRVTQPLPFPESLKEVIAWTDAFVDRIASLTHEQERKAASDKKEHKLNTGKLHEKVRKLTAQLEDARDEIQKNKDDAKEAEEELKRRINKLKADIEAQKALTSSQEKQAAAEKLRADDLEEKLKKALSNDQSDLDTIHELEALLGAVSVERDGYKNQYNQEVAKLVATNTELTNTKSLLAEKTARVSQLEAEIDSKKTEIANLTIKLNATKQKLEEVENILKVTVTNLQDLQTNYDKSLIKFQEIDNKLKIANETSRSLTADVDRLNAEKAAETAEKDKALVKLVDLTDKHKTLTTAHDLAKEELSTLRSELEQAKSIALSLSEGLEAAHKEKDEADERAKNAERSLQGEKDTQKKELANALLVAKVKGGHLQTELDAAKVKGDNLQAELDAAKKRVLPVAIPGKRVNILSVEYGGKAFTYQANKSVLDKLYAHAENSTAFDISNSFFETDPLRGIKKTASITYQLSSGGAPLQIVGVEYTKAKFE